MSRKLGLLLLLVTGLVVIVGCGSGGGSETTTESLAATTMTTMAPMTTSTETTGTTTPMMGELVVPLSGADVVPPVDNGATGTAVFMFTPGTAQQIEYYIYTNNLNEQVTAAHIHQGGPSENGDVLIWLYPPDKVPSGQTTTSGLGTGTTLAGESTTTSGMGTTGTSEMGGTSTSLEGIQGELLVHGTLTQDALQAAGMTLDQLTQLILSGQTYVQVHTQEHPGGALRGQILVPTVGGTTMTSEGMGGSTMTSEMGGSTMTSGGEMEYESTTTTG